MRLYHPPSGLRRGLEPLIDPNWSADQALAVIELLDDLRDRIWSHYELALFNKFCEDRLTCTTITPRQESRYAMRKVTQ